MIGKNEKGEGGRKKKDEKGMEDDEGGKSRW